MTAVLDRIPVDRISAETREVNVGRVVLALLALIPFVLGWLAGKLIGLVVWFGHAVAWVGLAVKAGYRDARPKQGNGD